MDLDVRDYVSVKMVNATSPTEHALVTLDGKVSRISICLINMMLIFVMIVGVYCDSKCNYGYWGSSCTETCDCNGGSCQSSSGLCSCLPGYKGTQCLQSKHN